MAELVLNQEKDILVASIKGEVTLLYSNDLKEKIKEELKNSQANKLVLDLSQVPMLDSSGLGMLISLFKYMNQGQGQIVYAGMTEYVKKIIGFAKLDKIFTIADDVDKALVQIV
ncbi:MAG: STAS domain-containing protein [Peptococcaceae bacterium]